MKKKFMFLLAVSILTFTGCSDDDDDNNYGIIPPAGTSLVSKITVIDEYYDEVDKDVLTFTYDSKNRISQVKVENEYTDNGVAIDGTEIKLLLKYSNENTITFSGDGKFWYNNDEVRSVNPHKKNRISSRAENSEETITITGSVTLNSNNYITSGQSSNKYKYWDDEDEEYYEAIEKTEWTANYSGSAIKNSKCITTEDDYTDTYEYEYTWNNGHLTQINPLNGYGNYELKYGETPNNEKINLDLNWIFYDLSHIQDKSGLFNLMGYYGNRSENMVEKYISYNTEYTCSYNFDKENRINKITVTRDSGNSTIIEIAYK